MKHSTGSKGVGPFNRRVQRFGNFAWLLVLMALMVLGGVVSSDAVSRPAKKGPALSTEKRLARTARLEELERRRELKKAKATRRKAVLRAKRIRAERRLERQQRRQNRNSTPPKVPAAATPARTPAPSVQQPPIPELARWESNMRTYGSTHCAMLGNSSTGFDTGLNATYYDAEWAYTQIAEYTGDPSWYRCADAAEKVYRDKYLMPNKGGVAGYWNFSHGLLEDYIRTGDQKSAEAVRLLATKAAYAADTTPLSSTADAAFSREVAYTIEAYLDAEELGDARRARLASLVDQALDHMDQWFGRKSVPYVRPFMVGLTSHALIRWYDKTGDARVLPAVRKAMDSMWAQLWIPAQGAFKYTDRVTSSGGTEAAPDLNLLIVPSYGWLYRKTGDVKYRDQGDAVFAGGVRGSYLVNPKQFNQSYRWSFEYVQMRK